jgi:hypothetical protein
MKWRLALTLDQGESPRQHRKQSPHACSACTSASGSITSSSRLFMAFE